MTLKNSFLADEQESKESRTTFSVEEQVKERENRNQRTMFACNELEKENRNQKRKNAFLADAYENMKRRNWVFWLSFLTFFCYFPGALVLGLNNIRSSYESVTEAAGLIRMQERMTETVENFFLLNGFMPVIVIGLAILIGMQSFVYLHNKRQVDFYHSQPVSRKRRFLILWVNGIVIFVVVYLVNMILGMFVAAAFGYLSSTIFIGAFEAFLLYLLLFLGIYHISIVAVLLTGNTLVSLLAMIVLLGYELAMRAMAVVMASSFFLTYGSGEENRIFDTLFSPIVTIYKYIVLGGKNYNYYMQYANESYTYGKTAFGLSVLAVVFGIAGFFLYQKRASESHGNSISFPKMKEVLRFALLFLIGGCGTYLIYYVAGANIAIGLVGAVFFVALGHAVIQLIYEVDFRAIRKKWLTAVISLAAVVLVFLGFKYDLTGYDSRIPKQSQVDSVYVSLVAEGFANNHFVMQDGTEIYGQYYAKKHMALTDLDVIYELLENRERINKNTVEFNGTYDTIEFAFRLKNGEIQFRRLYFKYEENMGLLNTIYHMDEYQLANNQVLEENFVEDYRIISAKYHNGLKEKELTSIDIKALVEAYKKDVANGDYAEVYYNIPLGKVTLYGVGFQSEEYRNAWNLLIYDSYVNTIALLEEAGISCKMIYDDVYMDTIQKIEVRFDDYEKMEQAEPEAVLTWEECYKTAIYTNKESYQKILENAIPSNNRWWGNNNRYSEDGYTIYIYTPNPYDGSDYYMNEVYFQTGEMPRFILDDLEKIPYGEEVIVERQ